MSTVFSCSTLGVEAVINRSIGVQWAFNAFNPRAKAVYLAFFPEKHVVVRGFPWKKRPLIWGRIGEVGPPAKRAFLLHHPLFAPGGAQRESCPAEPAGVRAQVAP